MPQPKNFQNIIDNINKDIVKAEYTKYVKKKNNFVIENNMLDDLKKEIKLYDSQKLRKSGAKSSSRMKPQAKKAHRLEPKMSYRQIQQNRE